MSYAVAIPAVIGVVGDIRFDTNAWIFPEDTSIRIELEVCGKLMTQSDSILVKYFLLQFWITVDPNFALIVKRSFVVNKNLDSYNPPPIETAG